MSTEPKSFFLTPDIHDYMAAHSTPVDAMQQALIDETNGLGDISIMQIAPEQAAFMTMLTRVIGARRVIEVGTFTGFSALAIARGLPDDGELLCCDVSEEWTAIARKHWELAGVGAKIDLRIAPAVETLQSLPAGEAYDLAFIDADKAGYPAYYEEIITRLRPNGLVLVDNTLFFGEVIKPDVSNESVVAIKHFNDLVAADTRVDVVMLAIGDGLTLLRKR